MRTLLILIAVIEAVHAEPPKEDELTTEPVVVTGTRTEQSAAEATNATRVIERKELQRIGARTAAEALRTTEGIRVESSFRGQTAQIDGLPARHTLVLINGRRVSGAKDGQLDLSRFRTEDIERIEIVRGPASTLYGSDALGGVINIITRTGDAGFTVEASGEYGMNEVSDSTATLAYGADFWRLALRGGWHGRGAFNLNEEDEATTAAQQESFNVGGDASFEWSTAGRLRLQSTYTNTDSLGVDTEESGAIYDRRIIDENLRSQLELKEQFKQVRVTLASAYEYNRSQYRLDQRGSGIGDKYEDSREHLVDSTLQTDISLPAAHLLTLGIDTLYEYLRSPRLETDTTTGSRTRAAFFIQDDWTPVEDEMTLTIVSGVRFDYDTQFGFNVAPSVALRFDPHEKVTVRSTFGLGYRAPQFKDLYLLFENVANGYIVEGNPGLSPESSIGGTVNLTIRPNDALSIDTQFFWHELDNLFDYQLGPSGDMPGIDRYRLVNVAKATSRGGTVGLRYEHQYIGLNVSYSFTDARDNTLNRPISQRPTHRATFDLNPRYNPWGLSCTVRAEVVGDRPFYSDTDGDRVEERFEASPYVLLSAWIGWQATSWMRVFVAGNNLTNAGHPLFAPLRPLTVRGGLSFSFNTVDHQNDPANKHSQLSNYDESDSRKGDSP
jgi:outer membrane receptor for ferrienterochelin and colicins